MVVWKMMMLFLSFNKTHKKLNDMKDNIDMINETTTPNSMTIRLHASHITHLMTGLSYPKTTP